MPDLLDRLKHALADRYTIERELGAGGMATVYLAEDLKHHRKVAVKVLRPEVAATVGPDRFLREIAVAAQLEHTHILTLIDSGESEGFLYYVMPVVEGESLRDRLHREKQLPVEEALEMMTINAADLLDVNTGAIKAGMIADLIAVEGNPLTDINALKGAHFVMKDGVVYKQEGRFTWETPRTMNNPRRKPQRRTNR